MPHEVRSDDYVRVPILGITLLKPIRFKDLREHGLSSLGNYLLAEYISPFLGRKFFGRDQQTRSSWQKYADAILEVRATAAKQDYQAHSISMMPGLNAYYNQGIGTALIQDMYTALVPDRAGTLREVPISFRKFGANEPTEAELQNGIRYAAQNKKAVMEERRDMYEQVHNGDFDLTAMFDRTNGDVEKFIDAPALRRWTVRDQTKLLKRHFLNDRRIMDVDGVSYTVNRYTPPYKIVDGKHVPKWDINFFVPHFTFSAIYKFFDILFNIIPTEFLQIAARQNFAKGEYKSIAQLWRSIFDGTNELAYDF